MSARVETWGQSRRDISSTSTVAIQTTPIAPIWRFSASATRWAYTTGSIIRTNRASGCKCRSRTSMSSTSVRLPRTCPVRIATNEESARRSHILCRILPFPVGESLADSSLSVGRGKIADSFREWQPTCRFTSLPRCSGTPAGNWLCTPFCDLNAVHFKGLGDRGGEKSNLNRLLALGDSIDVAKAQSSVGLGCPSDCLPHLCSYAGDFAARQRFRLCPKRSRSARRAGGRRDRDHGPVHQPDKPLYSGLATICSDGVRDRKHLRYPTRAWAAL